MARKIELSPAARVDIASIANYGATEFGIIAADQYREALEEKLRLIADFPEVGATDPMLGKGVRGLTAMSHRIIYRITKNNLLILRILHLRQLPPGLD